MRLIKLQRRLISAALRLLYMAYLALEDRLLRPALTGEADVDVSLTSHGKRLRRVHHTLRSLARGQAKARRVILWVDSDDAAATVLRNRAVAQMVRRGLEIRVGAAVGPHGKYWHYLNSKEHFDRPLVTADDDIIYDRSWLKQLISLNSDGVIRCYRAHEVLMSARGRLEPYASWPPVRDTQPSHRAFATGVSGVLYPAGFLSKLLAAGDAFRDVAPFADDVWLNAIAIRSGFRVAQLYAKSRSFPTVVGGQDIALWRTNTTGGNDEQLARAYDSKILALIASEANGESIAP